MPSLSSPRNYIRKHTKSRKSALKTTAYTRISSHPSHLVNLQPSSPLLALPFEIRHQIYTYALLCTPDLNCPLNPHTYNYRPEFRDGNRDGGFTHARHIATPLLQTCRRIYLETHLLPATLNEHILYGCEATHAPLNWKGGALFPKCRLRREQIREVLAKGRIRVFAQQYWLEDFNNREGGFRDFCAAMRGLWEDAVGCEDVRGGKRKAGWDMRITIRHTDWWHFLLGAESPLYLDPRQAGRASRRHLPRPSAPIPPAPPAPLPPLTPDPNSDPERDTYGFDKGSWGTRFRYLKGLSRLELELETLSHERRELQEVVAKAGEWVFALGDGNVLVHVPEETKWFTWRGSAGFRGVPKGLVGRDDGAGGRQGSWGTLASFRSGGSRGRGGAGVGIGEGEGEYEMLDYAVVVLVWKAQASGEEMAEARSVTVGHANGPPLAVPALGNRPAREASRDIIPSAWG